jgi:hypothetical protein
VILALCGLWRNGTSEPLELWPVTCVPWPVIRNAAATARIGCPAVEIPPTGGVQKLCSKRMSGMELREFLRVRGRAERVLTS